MSGAPITIQFYDKETNEPKKAFTRTFIPWKLLKRVSKLMKVFGNDFDLDKLDDESVDEISNLIVDIFGGQFTREELEDCTDLPEMVVVLQSVLGKVNHAMNPNPTEQA
jgi:hypothetical protein